MHDVGIATNQWACRHDVANVSVKSVASPKQLRSDGGAHRTSGEQRHAIRTSHIGASNRG